MCCARESLGRRQVILAVFWVAGVLAGLYKVTAYSIASPAVLEQPSRWPKDTTVPLAADRPTMLLSLHPRCACSRATVAELGRLLAELPSPVQVQILLYTPDTVSESWTESDLTSQARAMPSVVIRRDVKGLEAKRFGMSFSGHTALYAPDGRRLFRGGITRARGHEGDNAGRAAILSLVSQGYAATTATPVFGCSIRD
jgi:hypothetical protein